MSSHRVAFVVCDGKDRYSCGAEFDIGASDLDATRAAAEQQGWTVSVQPRPRTPIRDYCPDHRPVTPSGDTTP